MAVIALRRGLCPQENDSIPLVCWGVVGDFRCVVLTFRFWEVVWTNVQSGREQNVVAQQLEGQWRDKTRVH